MCGLADITVLYKEFPRTDVVECVEDVLTLVLRTIRNQIRPTTSLYDCRQIGSYPTTLPLMRAFVDKTAAMERKDGVLSISIGHCFPYADVPELGSRILVITDNDEAKADRLASEIGQEFIAMRGHTAPDYLAANEGIAAALIFNAGPVVLADPADNAGGGAPSDNTSILRRLIQRNVDGSALGPIWTRSPCGYVSMPGSARNFRCGLAARLAQRPVSQSMLSSLLPLCNADAGKASGQHRFRWEIAPRSASAASRWC